MLVLSSIIAIKYNQKYKICIIQKYFVSLYHKIDLKKPFYKNKISWRIVLQYYLQEQ